MTTRLALALLSLFLIVTNAHGQETYPAHPVKLIVPAAPGGGFDLFARQLGTRLGAQWGQQLVIENRGGGAGNIAASMTKQAKPDGYTLFIWNDALLINPSLFPDAGYDPRRDFTPIALPLFVPNVLVASKKSGLKSFAELVAAAKSGTSLFEYGSPGTGTPAHLGTELMQGLAAIKLVHVPYRGAGPALVDTVAGHIPLAVLAIPGAMEQIRAGAVTPLAVSSSERVAALPNVPTFQEVGLSDYRINTFFAFLGPAGMPPQIVAKLEKDIATALGDSEFRKQLNDQGFQVVAGDAARLKELIDRDLPVWSDLVHKSGAKAN